MVNPKALLTAALLSLAAVAQTRDAPPTDPRATPATLPSTACTITITFLARDPSKATAHPVGYCDDMDVDLALSVALANRLGLTAYR